MTDYITDPSQIRNTHHKYLDIIGMVWIALLIAGMFMSPKTFDLGPFSFSVSVILYPLIYIFADLFTEVYGYKKSRRIVWTGLACMFLVSLMAYFYSLVPSSKSFTDDAAFNTIFKSSPALAVAYIIAFFAGEFSNSYTMAKLKIYSNGKALWLRLVASTAIGQTLDNGTAYTLAWLIAGFFTFSELPNLIFSTVLFCTVWEFLATPITYKIVKFLKRAEGLDIYDRQTDFNPFSLKE